MSPWGARGRYLDPDGGAPALEEALSLGHEGGLVTGPHRAALALGGMALGRGRLQGQAHGLVAVQTVRGVVEAAAVLGPRGHPLGAAVLVGVLRGLGAALCRHRDQRLGGGAGGYGRWCLFVVGVGHGWKRDRGPSAGPGPRRPQGIWSTTEPSLGHWAGLSPTSSLAK